MWGINKFWIWLVLIIGTSYMEPESTPIVALGGIFYFIIWVMIGGPEMFQLKPGTWVKSVSQENNMTKIVVTDGEKDSIQQFTSTKVTIEGDMIKVH